MSDLFEADSIYYISIPDGKVFPGERNRKEALCQNCRSPLRMQTGFRFQAGRFAPKGWSSGYLCQTCLGLQVRAVPRWHFNAMEGILFPATVRTVFPLSGERLAEKFQEKGETGLLEAVKEAREELRKQALMSTG